MEGALSCPPKSIICSNNQPHTSCYLNINCYIILPSMPRLFPWRFLAKFVFLFIFSTLHAKWQDSLIFLDYNIPWHFVRSVYNSRENNRFLYLSYYVYKQWSEKIQTPKTNFSKNSPTLLHPTSSYTQFYLCYSQIFELPHHIPDSSLLISWTQTYCDYHTSNEGEWNGPYTYGTKGRWGYIHSGRTTWREGYPLKDRVVRLACDRENP
jgi:hypothetical protein